jgi:hypothetical protein
MGRTKGQIETELCDAVVKFEKEYMGRGPLEARAHIVGVRVKSLHTDISTVSGERVILFSLAAPVAYAQGRGRALRRPGPPIQKTSLELGWPSCYRKKLIGLKDGAEAKSLQRGRKRHAAPESLNGPFTSGEGCGKNRGPHFVSLERRAAFFVRRKRSPRGRRTASPEPAAFSL